MQIGPPEKNIRLFSAKKADSRNFSGIGIDCGSSYCLGSIMQKQAIWTVLDTLATF